MGIPLTTASLMAIIILSGMMTGNAGASNLMTRHVEGDGFMQKRANAGAHVGSAP